MAERTSWAAMELLSRGTTELITGSARSRLRSWLREWEPEQIASRLRSAGTPHICRAHPSALPRLARDVCTVDWAGPALGLAPDNSLHGYLDDEALRDVIARHGLTSDTRGRDMLRTTAMPQGLVERLTQRSVIPGAAILAGSLDPRERGAGLRAIGKAKDRLDG